MKRAVGIAVCSLFFIFLLPLLLGGGGQAQQEERPSPNGGAADALPAAALLPAARAQDEPSPPPVYAGDDETMLLTLLRDGMVSTISMRDYLPGVLAAEVPASFETEALKAQAVAARTYTLWKLSVTSVRHPEARVCADSACCQAYRTPEEAAARWGEQAEACAARIAEAVAATDGLALLYDGAPIQALFHSSSGGYTEAAVSVWNSDVPYLQSVTSPEDIGTVPNYYSTRSFSAEQLRALLSAAFPAADLSGPPEGWFQNLSRSGAGGVLSVDVGGVAVRGTALRSLLGLRSASFTPVVNGDEIRFQVMGYGHGVGMSQYGANLLASAGMDYAGILLWYYTGVTLGRAPSAQ